MRRRPDSPCETGVPDPDREIVQRFCEGDDRAFDELLERYRKPVLDFLYRMVGDAHQAEDEAQEVFVRVYRNIRAFRPRGRARFSTWLFCIARNAALDRLRRRRVRRTEPLDLAAEVAAPDDPAADAQRRETAELVACAVAELPVDQREALILAEYEDQTATQIARILGCSIKAVESRLYRARQFLRARLARLLGDMGVSPPKKTARV